jgi:hypothetical protein
MKVPGAPPISTQHVVDGLQLAPPHAKYTVEKYGYPM